ncbi:MAG: DUF4238 domain-containing protein [Bacilli bacterium]|nr:DUF4238 domain-containing protein [Bacilli bacterium]
MANSHYVPMLTLRRFSDKLCLFNVRTGEYRENVQIAKSFSEDGFYSDEVEEKLNRRIESQFGNLFNNKLLHAEGKIELKRDELYLIKKFLLISVIRSMGNEEFMQVEKKYYDNLNEYGKRFAKDRGLEEKKIDPPFLEKEIAEETPFDYWMRTLEVILDTNGRPQEILGHPSKTYPAHRWAEVINNGYVAFWDSEFAHDEFVITDIGMTSENEKGWNGTTVHNVKKTNFYLSLMERAKSDQERIAIFQSMNLHHNFTENFMMFPISAKRMIVLIDPFYKFRIAHKDYYKMPELNELTLMPNEKLFYPNDNKYVLKQSFGQPFKYHPDDLYIYEIKKLTSKETRYCNELFLDRINTWVGFSDLNKAVGSIFAYFKANKYPYIPRVDYTELYKIINERYLANIDISEIGGLRR